MTLERFVRTEYLPVPLIALMILTRYHHFGDALHLPDASLAVFFLAGFYRSKLLPGFLLILAALIDYLAIANGADSYCVTPAYVFLLPTYGVMWLGGRYCGRRRLLAELGPGRLAGAFAVLLTALSLAFLISNGGFYAFSGKFGDLTWGDYAGRVARYYPMYLKSTLIYGAVGVGVYAALKNLIAIQRRRSAA